MKLVLYKASCNCIHTNNTWISGLCLCVLFFIKSDFFHFPPYIGWWTYLHRQNLTESIKFWQTSNFYVPSNLWCLASYILCKTSILDFKHQFASSFRNTSQNSSIKERKMKMPKVFWSKKIYVFSLTSVKIASSRQFLTI